ncbi:hypothetical protein, partial [Escherichia coli]|uniref:hypothetical protein n=1 Tax=Escherichia coli TaxID=562 RepID=UPI003EB75DB9
ASACRRGTDRVFRLYTAGDEFCVLLPGAGSQVALHVAQQAQWALRREGLSASIGLAYTDHTSPVSQGALLRAADGLMQQ